MGVTVVASDLGGDEPVDGSSDDDEGYQRHEYRHHGRLRNHERDADDDLLGGPDHDLEWQGKNCSQIRLSLELADARRG